MRDQRKDKVTELNYYRGKFFHLAVALFVSLIGVVGLMGFLQCYVYLFVYSN